MSAGMFADYQPIPPKPNFQCPACGGSNTRDGSLQGRRDIRFKPNENWFQNHQVDATVCLDCGIVTLRLPPSDLKLLRDE